MNTERIQSSLADLFRAQRLVFWFDGGGAFDEAVRALALDGVSVLRLDEVGSFAAKVRLELEDPEGSYLVYSARPEPAEKDDWLLDLRLYSHTFYADQASMILHELGLKLPSARGHLALRLPFFNSQERLGRLKRLVLPGDGEDDLDLKMIAVLVRADQPQLFSILLRLFSDLEPTETPKAWGEVTKHGLDGFFWKAVQLAFGYAADAPSLHDLLTRLLATDLALSLRGAMPHGLAGLVLPDKKLAQAAPVFLSQWRHDGRYSGAYRTLAAAVEVQLDVPRFLAPLDASALCDVMTFEEVERRTARALKDRIEAGDFTLPAVQEVIKRRREGYWVRSAHPSGPDEGSVADYPAVYEALECAARLFDLRSHHAGGLSYPTLDAMHAAYTRELYRFDQLYRLFSEAADAAELAGMGLLKGLRQRVEDCYSQWFMVQTALAWAKVLRTESGAFESWSVGGVPNQQDFYREFVRPLVAGSEQAKAYVIVSDALRYEVAAELADEINAKNRFEAELKTQLGVLPSVTSLGMAALLPHKSLAWKEGNGGEILVDGRPCSSLEQRATILQAVKGTAIRASNLMAMNRAEARAFGKESQVLYIYHNEIDATGDQQTSEGKTFQAARTAIDEIAALINFIGNTLGGTHILVTADHGFLYQDAFPEASDRSAANGASKGVVRSKKRYILGRGLGAPENLWRGDTRVTAGTDNAMEFLLPKGQSLFHFAGGARYVHGGAMPQEVVVPVVVAKQLSGKAAKEGVVKKVDVTPLGVPTRIVNGIQVLRLLQNEPVSDKVHSRTVRVFLADGGDAISNEEIVTFDSDAKDLETLTRKVTLRVRPGNYDKERDYRLVLVDQETKVEYLAQDVRIDLTFMNDF